MDSKKNMENRNVVTLMTFQTQGEAEVIHSLLESVGIQAIVQNDLLAGMFPAGTPMLSIRLVVASDDEVRAREILNAKFDPEELEREYKNYKE